MLSGSMRFGRSAGGSSGSKSAAHRRGLRLSEDPALPSRRSPARGLIDHFRARFATILENHLVIGCKDHVTLAESEAGPLP